MDSPGWFDSGYVVPGDPDDGVSTYAGETIYVNYDQSKTKYGDVIVEGKYNEIYYPTGYKTPQNYSIDINLDNTKTKYGDTIVNDVYTNVWYPTGYSLKTKKTEVPVSRGIVPSETTFNIETNYNETKTKWANYIADKNYKACRFYLGTQLGPRASYVGYSSLDDHVPHDVGYVTTHSRNFPYRYYNSTSDSYFVIVNLEVIERTSTYNKYKLYISSGFDYLKDYYKTQPQDVLPSPISSYWNFTPIM